MAVALAALLLPAVAAAHPERITAFTFPVRGHVPTYRTTGPSNVVCTKTSRSHLRKEFKGRALRTRLRLLARCRYHTIQSAIDHAKSGYRIQILPGSYFEVPSRKVPLGSPGQPPCAHD